MRQAALFLLVLLVLWLPYRLGMRSHESFLDAGMLQVKLSADQAAASPMRMAGSVTWPSADPAAVEVETGRAAENPPPVLESDAAVAPTGSDEWYGVDGRPPVVLTHPNPFRLSTQVAYTLPHATHALVKVYNAFGREVTTLSEGYREEGTYVVTLDGSRLEPGTYVCVLETGSATVAEEIVLSE